MALSLSEKNKFAAVRFLLTVIISLIGLISCGQSQAELILSSADSLTFFLAIDGVAVPDSAKAKFKVVTQARDVLIEIVLSDSSGRDLSTNITMENNIRTAYEITELRTGLALLQVSREMINFVSTETDPALYPESDSSMYGIDSALYIQNLDVSAASSTLTISQLSSVELTEYNALCVELYAGYFEKEKTKQALEFVENYKHSVPDLVHILEFLSYEDNRLIVAKRAFPKLVDPQNFLVALDYFHLERSKVDLEKFFNDLDQ